MQSHVGRYGVDTELFQHVILHGYVLDGSYAFLDQRHSLAFAEKCMNVNMFLDQVN